MGERGEIALKGPTLMLGYLGKTLDQTFDDEGFFRTGDAGWLDAEGNVFWDGRMTDMIKTGGANVAPDEVDRAIAAFPGIRITQTVGVPDEMFSEIVVSCIVPRSGHTIAEDALRAFLKERLASYKIPRRILFFRDDEVSLTGSGAKVKAGEMREKVIARLAAESGTPPAA
jgi:acyl-CoA synthetase (AMP-forming)/AMP-acid ligase II